MSLFNFRKTMKKLEYNNINCDFSLVNICFYLESFWLKKVLMSNYSKIWLKITVSDNIKSRILINNIPFNTSDYSDIIIVLKQSINSNILELTNVKKITFEYFIEKEIIDNKYKNIKIFLFVSVFLLLFICNIELFYDNSVEKVIFSNIDTNICVEIDKKYVKSSNPFINMFKKDNTCSYFPSYFLSCKLDAKFNTSSLQEHILYQQYYIINKHSIITNKLFEDVLDIINEYISHERNILNHNTR